MNESELNEARAFFEGDRFCMVNGAVIDEIGPDYAVCSLEVTDRHRNALGNVMGGAVFMLADFAFAVASNFGHQPTVTTTSQISFLRGAKGDKLYARSERVRAGRSVVFYETSVTDSTGTLVARVTATGNIVG